MFVRTHRFDVIQSKICNVPFNTPADDDPGFRPIIHHRANVDFSSLQVVLLGDNDIQSRTDFGVVPNCSFWVAVRVVSSMGVFVA